MSLFDFKKLTLPCIAASVLALTACDQVQQQQKQAMPVDVYTVKTMDVPVISHLTGRANPTRKAEVRPQVNGILQKRLFVEGSTVHQGDQLYQIDPDLYNAKVASAKASLASAQANLRSAKLKATRYGKLRNDNAISSQDNDDAQAVYLTAEASVKAAEAELKTAEINLAYTKVYAPISGTISRSDITEGALVSAGQQSPLTTIQQLDPIYIDMGMTAEEHIALKKNLTNGKLLNNGKASVDIFYSDGTPYEHKGEVAFTDVSVNESTGMVNLRAIVPNPDHILLPGIFLRGDINQGVLPQAVVIQADGVQREANGNCYAYIVDENSNVARRDIKLGAGYDRYYIVNSGLNAGDKVIITNVQKIRAGMPVIAIDEETAKKMAEQQAAMQNKQAAK